MKRLLLLLSLFAALQCPAQRPLPITGSWINLFYQDVRNKYSNPEHLDNTSPELWRAKVEQMHRFGIEYIVFMAMANEGLADYPSRIMPHAYSDDNESPVSAIIDEAEKHGMKVFLSIGWAENQDDNLKRPEILNRQLAIMEELADIYGNSKAFYGWYLPVEDCLGPVLPESSVTAINRLVEKVRVLTPGKKTMISPYGFFCSDFDNPKFAEQIGKLKVDIIAYQDEAGCVREEYPLPRLRENWKKISKIHENSGIELWANCELFTWEKGTNSRSSALIPASMSRIAVQLQAATDGGVKKIISFMTCGIIDDGADNFVLGQPVLSKVVADEYGKWKKGDEKYLLLEKSLSGLLKNNVYDAANPLFDNVFGDESPNNKAWQKIPAGYKEFIVRTDKSRKLYLRFLNCGKKNISVPYKVSLSAVNADGAKTLCSVHNVESFPNNLHDTWIDGIVLDIPENTPRVIIGIFADTTVMIDEIVVGTGIQ